MRFVWVAPLILGLIACAPSASGGDSLAVGQQLSALEDPSPSFRIRLECA